jgi:hypothetical protein
MNANLRFLDVETSREKIGQCLEVWEVEPAQLVSETRIGSPLLIHCVLQSVFYHRST